MQTHYFWVAGLSREQLEAKVRLAPYVHPDPKIVSVMATEEEKFKQEFPHFIKHPLNQNYFDPSFEFSHANEHDHLLGPLSQYYTFSDIDGFQVRLHAKAGARSQNVPGLSFGSADAPTAHVIAPRLLSINNGELTLSTQAIWAPTEWAIQEREEWQMVAPLLEKMLWEMLEKGEWTISRASLVEYVNVTLVAQKRKAIELARAQMDVSWETYVSCRSSLVRALSEKSAQLDIDHAALKRLDRWPFTESLSIQFLHATKYKWVMSTVPLKFGKRKTRITVGGGDGPPSIVLSNRTMSLGSGNKWVDLARALSGTITKTSVQTILNILESLTVEDFVCQMKVGKQEILE